ncbi:M20/M25/M40 family metallo-hydrolase [Rhodobaculum claviforme]|uniref:Peptidase M20 dimerisation domain-containing protein n=1 Tax=Rhodobaculum claviforme TaxID=1549854 RepID=A0A934WKK3_9RHOB|nr:M20/M25/M40 family metallo-hydrolase [Rhodobaculum claviforme]MBK5928648.1 hypothetical protein [Rhodobaculum claviforme]
MPSASFDELRETVLCWIEEDRERLIAFLSAFTAIPTPNPPGDTVLAAGFLLDHLHAHGLPGEILAAKPHLPNIVGAFDGAAPGRHLVLNGHIDVFPAGDAALWSRDPWSGDIADGRVHGRGVVDMKCGTTASVWAYGYMHRLREHLAGRLTLTCVSDEETGGTWGARWLLETFPDRVRGDCMLNGEPSVPTLVRYGEKGTLRVHIDVDTPGAHAAYVHKSANAIEIATRIITELYSLAGQITDPDAVPLPPGAAEAIDAGLGAGASAILNRTTVSVGVIQGGVKINVLPGTCRFEVDLRLPPAMTHAFLLAQVEEIMARHPQARLTPIWTHSCEPTRSDPGHEMVGIVQRTVEGLGRPVPVPSVSLGATDCKHWRQAGTPSYVYGCSPEGMGAADEAVDIDEFLHIVRTHALSCLAYLMPRNA